MIASNRRARRDYEVVSTIEVGMVLRGSEVKSLREGKVQLAESWARVNGGELWLHNLHISSYSHSSTAYAPEPDRVRKLLAHRRELRALANRVHRERLTLVPLAMYFTSRGHAKMVLALAKGRTRSDRRQEIARREADREAARAIAANSHRFQTRL